VNEWACVKDEYRLCGCSISLFEYAEDDNRWVARHHPFTAPKPDHISVMINNNPVIEKPPNI
jgi:aspartyl-tRNA synthetase